MMTDFYESPSVKGFTKTDIAKIKPTSAIRKVNKKQEHSSEQKSKHNKSNTPKSSDDKKDPHVDVFA